MELHNLRKNNSKGYTTWGCMWEKGSCPEGAGYVCRNPEGTEVPMQSRITAYWQDGSVKWTAHTADAALLGDKPRVLPGAGMDSPEGIVVVEEENTYTFLAGRITVEIPREGNVLFDRVLYGKKICAGKAAPVLLLEEPAVVKGCPARLEKKYPGRIKGLEIEERGQLPCIVKFTGCHVNQQGEERLPFIIRMTIGYDCPELKLTHTFVYDGDEEKDYLKGLGITFDVPEKEEIYNRHIKLTGDYGVFHESLVHFISWRPKVSKELYQEQMRGKGVMPEGENLTTVNKILKDTPFWSEYDICQDSVSHFSVRKKLQPDNCCYIDSLHGCSIWFWSPSAPAMDFRHYANRGYNQVCYEGYDYKGATPEGIACTTERSSLRNQMDLWEDGNFPCPLWRRWELTAQPAATGSHLPKFPGSAPILRHSFA